MDLHELTRPFLSRKRIGLYPKRGWGSTSGRLHMKPKSKSGPVYHGDGYIGFTAEFDASPVRVGMKFDTGKRRFSLLAWDAIGALVDVLEYGATKYEPGNWVNVVAEKDGERRFFDAALRHLTAWWGGERCDPETKLSHLVHAMACIMFLAAHDLRTRGTK